MQKWCVEHPTGYPPIVLHITDGHPTDGNPEQYADLLKGLTTTDGPCLFFNLHLDVGSARPQVFPNDERMLRDRFGKTLFRMSSELPAHAAQIAKKRGRDVTPGHADLFLMQGSKKSSTFLT